MAFRADEERRLRELLDERAIRAVVLRYCRGIDRLDESLVRACYHPDATDEHGSFTGGVDAFIEWVFRLQRRNEMSFHFVGNVLVDFEAAHPDLARCESYGVSIHRRHSERPEHNLMVGFRYVDTFERRADEWRILRRVCTTEWTRIAAKSDEWPTPEGMRTGRRDRGDVVYEALRGRDDEAG